MNSKVDRLLLLLRESFKSDGPFHVEFRARVEDDWPKTLDYWFGSARWRRSGHMFELVGVDSTGGMYCLWDYPDISDAPSPVVFLGSEGEGVCVVARSLPELLHILTDGYHWDGLSEKYVRDESLLFVEALDALRRKASGDLASGEHDPNKAAIEARAGHPNFKAWVDGQID